MTVMEAIEAVDALEPNQYDTGQKMAWLYQLDGQISNEVIATHEGRVPKIFPYEDGDEELLVEAPYDHDIYVNYLLAQIHNSNGESRRYQSAAAIYNNAYKMFTSWYNRTHMPVSRGTWKI